MIEEKPSNKIRDLRYRAYVCPADKYDLIGAAQFNLLTRLGLREDHHLLDIGCGSLCAGRLLIPYLLPNRYYGIEPLKWLIDEGLKNELGFDILDIKKPVFNNNQKFELSVFGRKFDYLLAHSIFTHAGINQINRCLEEAKEVMSESSVFLATFMLSNNDDYDPSWRYNTFSFYRWDTVLELYHKNGLSCNKLDLYHPIDQTWVLGELD